MLNNDKLIEVYNDYDSKLYAPSFDSRNADLVFPPKDENNQPYTVALPLQEIRNLYRLSPNIFKRKHLRILDEEEEKEVFKILNINMTREKECYSREEIEYLLTNATQHTIDVILSIQNLDVINTFLAQFVYLKNTNKYFLPQKVEDYIRARKEELEQGLRNTELEGSETANIPTVDGLVDVAVIEEKEEELKAKEEELKAKEKALKEKEKAIKEKAKAEKVKKTTPKAKAK